MNVYMEKFRKGAKSMNFVKEALIVGEAKGEVKGQVKMCKLGFNLSLEQTINKIPEEDPKIIKEIYLNVQKKGV